MKHISINQEKCKEWDLNLQQAILLDLIVYLPNASWREVVKFNGYDYYLLSRERVIRELSCFYKLDDTVYRNLKKLEKKGIIDLKKEGRIDCVRLLPKGENWVNK